MQWLKWALLFAPFRHPFENYKMVAPPVFHGGNTVFTIPVVALHKWRSTIWTGWAVSPCTTTYGSGGVRSAAGPVPPDQWDATCQYWGGIHIDFRAIPLSIGMQQAVRKIIQNKLRAGEAMAATLPRRGVSRRIVLSSKLSSIAAKASPLLIKRIGG
jgi:hypothetical protein